MGKPTPSPTLKWTGTKGNDTAFVTTADALAHTNYDAGAGIDTLNLSGMTSGVSMALSLGNQGSSRVWPYSPFHGSWWDYIDNGLVVLPVVNGSINNFEMVVGTSFNDYIKLGGGSVGRVANGGAGDDAIYVSGSTGTNTQIGGTGSDQLFGSYSTDLLIGGTWDGSHATADNERDEFEASAGTILDFEVGRDSLYIDASNTSQVITTSWFDVQTSYGAAARLQISATRAITVVGVDAQTMNSTPNGYAMTAVNGQLTSGPGDDFIWDGASTTSVDHFKFGPGSGDDELSGFDIQYDSLAFSSAPTWTQTTYHGDAALLATFDGGASSVLLIGISSADIPNLHIDPWG